MDLPEMEDFLILLDKKYKDANIKDGKYSDDLLRRYFVWKSIREQRLWIK